MNTNFSGLSYTVYAQIIRRLPEGSVGMTDISFSDAISNCNKVRARLDQVTCGQAPLRNSELAVISTSAVTEPLIGYLFTFQEDSKAFANLVLRLKEPPMGIRIDRILPSYPLSSIGLHYALRSVEPDVTVNTQLYGRVAEAGANHVANSGVIDYFAINPKIQIAPSRKSSPWIPDEILNIRITDFIALMDDVARDMGVYRTKIKTCLRRMEKLKYLGDLLRLKSDDVQKMGYSTGRKTVRQLRECLSILGKRWGYPLKLGMGLPYWSPPRRVPGAHGKS